MVRECHQSKDVGVEHIPEVQSQCSNTHYFPLQNPSLLFHKVGTHSPRKPRTEIGGQTDRIKRYSLHFSRQGGVEGSRVKWILIRTLVRHLLLRTESVS